MDSTTDDVDVVSGMLTELVELAAELDETTTEGDLVTGTEVVVARVEAGVVETEVLFVE